MPNLAVQASYNYTRTSNLFGNSTFNLTPRVDVTLADYAPGMPVNLEVDVMGRYVIERLKGRREEGAHEAIVTREYLARHGFGGRGGAR